MCGKQRKKIIRFYARAVLEMITSPIKVPLLFLWPEIVCPVWGHAWSKRPWAIELEDEPVYKCPQCGQERMEDTAEVQTINEYYEEITDDC